MKIAVVGLAVLASLLGGCYTMSSPTSTIGGDRPSSSPPARVARVTDVVQGEAAYDFQISIYPGLDEHFDPNPTLTLAEYNQIRQLDWFCAREADKLSGFGKQVAKQALSYAVPIGIMQALGAKWAFGHLISAGDYLKLGLASGTGAGIAAGDVTYANAKRIIHGYCMTGMAHKAQQLEGKLARIFIIPVYAGETEVPQVAEKPAPAFRAARTKSSTTKKAPAPLLLP